MSIRIVGVLLVALGLLTVTGCWTTQSPQGGIKQVNQEFSLTVPSSNSVKQGGELSVVVTLNRGAYFKQDVVLVVRPEGLVVTPETVLIKASDKPDVTLRFAVPREAAIGKYRVIVKGTPETGETTKTEFVVDVVSQ